MEAVSRSALTLLAHFNANATKDKHLKVTKETAQVSSCMFVHACVVCYIGSLNSPQ